MGRSKGWLSERKFWAEAEGGASVEVRGVGPVNACEKGNLGFVSCHMSSLFRRSGCRD